MYRQTEFAKGNRKQPATDKNGGRDISDGRLRLIGEEKEREDVVRQTTSLRKRKSGEYKVMQFNENPDMKQMEFSSCRLVGSPLYA